MIRVTHGGKTKAKNTMVSYPNARLAVITKAGLMRGEGNAVEEKARVGVRDTGEG